MKQILSLALALLPCLALAQYPSNGNQKITLGEQTTADGLFYRGLAADTTRKPSVDTMAYMLLDTATNIMWHYKKATSNAWLRVGGSISSGLTGTLPVANGGTGASSLSPNNYLIRTNSSGIFDTSAVYEAGGNVGIGATPSAWYTGYTAMQIGESASLFSNRTSADTRTTQLANNAFLNSNASNWIYQQSDEATRYGQVSGEHQWFTAPSGTAGNAITFTQAMTLDADGDLGINTASPSEKLHVVGNGRFTAVGAGTFSNNLNITSDGTLTTETSDIKFKYNIRPLSYGLETLLQLKPVNFQWIEGEEEDLGFIAQDVAEIIPESVNTNWNSDLLFRYESLIPILTKAIQEQQALIKALEQRIINLENK